MSSLQYIQANFKMDEENLYAPTKEEQERDYNTIKRSLDDDDLEKEKEEREWTNLDRLEALIQRQGEILKTQQERIRYLERRNFFLIKQSDAYWKSKEYIKGMYLVVLAEKAPSELVISQQSEIQLLKSKLAAVEEEARLWKSIAAYQTEENESKKEGAFGHMINLVWPFLAKREREEGKEEAD